MRAKLAVMLIALALLTSAGTAFAYESISGTVISVHFTPGCNLDQPCVTVSFIGNKTMTFAYSALANEIRVDNFNTIYYNERNQIIKVETGIHGR